MKIRKKGEIFAMLAVCCAVAAVCFGSAGDMAYGAVSGETQILIADFGGTAAETVFGISGWNTVIRDVYTGYRAYGPGGTVIAVGSEPGYNYQGVTGQPRTFSAGERIAVTWYNNSDAAVTFAPKISSDDPDRRIAGTAGTWRSMSSTVAGPRETAQSFFEFGADSEGTYGIVNVNVNYANHEILICDRIELIIPGTDTEPPSVPQNLRAEIIFGLHILLIWDHSPDNAATAGYRIYSGDGTEIGNTADTEYMIADAGPGTHTYTVTAYDVSGNGSAPSGLTVTVRSGEALLLADFGGTAGETLFGISGWNTVIKDVYTGYRAYGPGGTAVTVGSEAGYNYQGVTGQPRSFAAGERIAVTWYNNSDTALGFAPKISSDDPDRRVMGTAGTWRSMSSTVAGPRESAQSFFEFDEGSQGTYGLVNVNVNYANHEILVCDRIELIIPGTAPDTEPPSVPQNLSAAQIPAVSGCRISLSWDASSDDTGVTDYEIFRDGTFLAEVPDTEYNDSDVFPGISYTYTVRACDAAGNCSEQSGPASVTVSGGNTAPAITITEPDGTDDTAQGTFTVKWTDGDPDDNAQISLYYADTPLSNGTHIVSGLSEDADGTGDEYVWNVSEIPAGSYYVCAVITDGANPPATACSSGPATIISNMPAPEILRFTADTQTVASGSPAVLTWKTVNAESISIDNGIGDVPAEGSRIVTPQEDTVYTLTAAGPGGTVNAGLPIAVTSPRPAVSISASPSAIVRGQSSVLTWSSARADTCIIEPGIGSAETGGTLSITPASTTTYTVTVSGPGGTAEAQAKVAVRNIEVQPQPEGFFGSRYEDLIPSDTGLENYDPEHFSVIAGLVRNAGGNPLAGVTVRIHHHPEYGTCLTDEEGRFSLPVPGGGVLTVIYEKEGHITAHRQAEVPDNDIVTAETPVLTEKDSLSTEVSFDGNPGTVISHRSTQIADAFGTRSCTMVFTGDNMAHSADAEGNVIGDLSSITVRATEFATPESMPAVLPPNSAYTYCAELGADQAERVSFDKPVVVWVDNFLGFAAGSRVPAGWYDRDRAVWVPSDNGKVVRILDTDGNTVADALDADADGTADDLDGDGSFSDEIAGLDSPAPNALFWRFEVTHFTPWDCNWPYGPPEDSTEPNAKGLPCADGQCENDCFTDTNSYIEDRSRIFHEDIPVPGTGMTLHYASNRTEGYASRIRIPVSGDTVPDSLEKNHCALFRGGPGIRTDF